MAYTQGETIDLTANSGGLLLFSSAAASSYEPGPVFSIGFNNFFIIGVRQ